MAYDNTRCCVSKRRSPVITNPWWFCLAPFVLICLHGHSLVVVVISSCFGMKLQSKYASVCLLKQLWGKTIVPSKHVRLFFCCCLEISFRPQDVFGILWCISMPLFMSSSWLNTFTNQHSYFLDEQLGCQKQSNQSSCRSFFVSVICSNFTHEFGVLLYILLLKHWFQRKCSSSEDFAPYFLQ